MSIRALCLPLLILVACDDVKETGEPENENEVITTVTLDFTPDAGGDALSFSWSDPENDGSPVIDDISLPQGGYTLSVSFLNALEEPAEDITVEVQDEGDQHQVFYTGSAVQGPATGDNASAVIEHAYADTDGNGLPVGLDNTVTTLAAGSGDLVVTLRHMPPESGEAVKTAEAAETVAAEGMSGIGGDTDVEVTFSLTVE